MPSTLFARPLTLLLGMVLGTLTACSGGSSTPTPSPTPSSSLPAPLPGVNITGVYRGDSTVTGQGCPPTVACGPYKIAVVANLTDTNGVLTGHETVYVNGLQASDHDLSTAGSNNGGTLSFPVTFAFCDQKVNLTLNGTVNPADTLNFAQLSQAVTCKGQSGSFVVAAFAAHKVVNQ